MRKGWESKKLGDVCSFLNRGISPKYLDDGGICVLNQKCIRDHRVNFSQTRRHDINSKIINSERYVQLGDVLVNSTGTGTLGRVAQIRETRIEPTIVDSHVTIVRPKPGMFFNDFFGYTLINIEELIKEAGEGCGGQTELSRSVLAEKFSVNYPISLDEQQHIVSILDKAFADIATAKANAEKNLQNARALFESYLNTVFSDRNKEWHQTFLEKVLVNQPQNGWSPPAANHSNSGTPVLTLSSVTGFHFRPDKIKYTSAPTDSARKYWVKNGDLLITRSNTPELVGHVAIASDINEPTIYPDLIMRMNPIQDLIITEFLYFQLRTRKLRNLIVCRANGANPTMKKISNGAVKSLPIAVPRISVQQSIVAKLAIITTETQRLETLYQNKLTALEELKKSILHKAFSGEL